MDCERDEHVPITPSRSITHTTTSSTTAITTATLTLLFPPIPPPPFLLAWPTQELSALTNMHKLDLRRNVLHSITPGALAGSRETLVQLLLDGNALAELPHEISQLTQSVPITPFSSFWGRRQGKESFV